MYGEVEWWCPVGDEVVLFLFVLIDWDVAVRIKQFLNYTKRKLKENRSQNSTVGQLLQKACSE